MNFFIDGIKTILKISYYRKSIRTSTTLNGIVRLSEPLQLIISAIILTNAIKRDNHKLLKSNVGLVK